MFEKLFCSKAVLRRHLEGPLSVERAAYLEELAAQGMARGTLLHRASYCLCVAVELPNNSWHLAGDIVRVLGYQPPYTTLVRALEYLKQSGEIADHGGHGYRRSFRKVAREGDGHTRP